jgi:hypothetical protein
LDDRWLVKLVEDGDGPHNVIKGVGERSNDGHDSQLIIEIVEGEGGRGERLDHPDVLIHSVNEGVEGF